MRAEHGDAGLAEHLAGVEDLALRDAAARRLEALELPTLYVVRHPRRQEVGPRLARLWGRHQGEDFALANALARAGEDAPGGAVDARGGLGVARLVEGEDARRGHDMDDAVPLRLAGSDARLPSRLGRIEFDLVGADVRILRLRRRFLGRLRTFGGPGEHLLRPPIVDGPPPAEEGEAQEDGECGKLVYHRARQEPGHTRSPSDLGGDASAGGKGECLG